MTDDQETRLLEGLCKSAEEFADLHTIPVEDVGKCPVCDKWYDLRYRKNGKNAQGERTRQTCSNSCGQRLRRSKGVDSVDNVDSVEPHPFTKATTSRELAEMRNAVPVDELTTTITAPMVFIDFMTYKPYKVELHGDKIRVSYAPDEDDS